LLFWTSAIVCRSRVQPLIVLWFLRRWKRMVAVLAVYDVFLVPAILMLEWHYFVDMLGGIAIAAVVIWIVGDTPEGTLRSATVHVSNKLTMLRHATAATTAVLLEGIT
jgi:hypothetical protein